MNRRDFLFTLSATAILSRRYHGAGELVELIDFADDGRRIGPVRVAKIAKTDTEWRSQLSVESFQITRRRGTERPFTGAYWNLHAAGFFRCICCGTALFSSDAKFDSGTGWPSFWQPIAEQNLRHAKPSHGYTDSEVTCARCDAHLGDLFDDGPKPTGLRYCIDSAALRFVKAEAR